MTDKDYCFVSPTSRAVATAAALLISFGAAATAQTPRVFNGEHTLSFIEEDWRPDPMYVGFGENQDGTVNFEVAWVIRAGPGSRLADSDGSGTHNTAIINLDSESRLAFDQEEIDYIGYDGTGIINIDGTVIPWDPDATAVGNLQTRQVELGALPGSEGIVNVFGEYARWNPSGWHVDVGVQGYGEINITDGARMTNTQRVVVGGTRWTPTSGQVVDEDTGEIIVPPTHPVAGGTGVLNVDGEGTHFATSTTNVNTLIGIGRRGTGTVTVSNGAVFDALRDTDTGVAFWVGNQEDGDGTLIVESGGVVNVNGIFRINSNSSDRGYVRIDGPGSQLNAEIVGTTSTNFLGNTPRGEDNPDAIGIMEIVNGGSAIFENAVRIGNQEGSVGEVHVTGEGSVLEVGGLFRPAFGGHGTLTVTDGGRVSVDSSTRIAHGEESEGYVTVDGPGSLLETSSFLQVGYEGFGSLQITNGARVEVPLTSGSISSSGRLEGAVGETLIEGEGSELIAPRFIMGSDTGLSPTGVASMVIRDGGHFLVGGLLGLRNGSTVELDNGSITMEPTVGTRPDIIDIGLDDGSLLFGTGTIDSDIIGVVQGTGDGIVINGALVGGEFENVLASGVDIAPAEREDREEFAPLTLNNVRFAENAPFNITINDIENVVNLVTFDGETDFSGTHLMIQFEPFAPFEEWNAQIFQYTGPGAADYNFASVTVPDGWVFDNGLLYHESAGVPDDTAYEQWAAGYGLTGGDAAPGANPSGDGHTNEAKFAFGADPTIAVAVLVDVSRDGDLLVLRWNRSTDSGVQYTIEERPDLATGQWNSVPGAEPQVMAEPDLTPPSGYERVEWSVDVSGQIENGFFRVTADVDSSLLP